MENTKYITLEQDLQRIENCIEDIKSQIDFEAFKSYGRYAYMYDKHYYGGKPARFQVRKTLRSMVKVTKSIQKKLKPEDDVEILRRALKSQIEAIKLQQLFF